jgi:phage tail sheath gpL-like
MLLITDASPVTVTVLVMGAGVLVMVTVLQAEAAGEAPVVDAVSLVKLLPVGASTVTVTAVGAVTFSAAMASDGNHHRCVGGFTVTVSVTVTVTPESLLYAVDVCQ